MINKLVTVQCKNLETDNIAYGKTLDIKDGVIQWFEHPWEDWRPLSERFYPLEVRRYAQHLLKMKAFW